VHYAGCSFCVAARGPKLSNSIVSVCVDEFAKALVSMFCTHKALQRSGAPYGNTNMHKAYAVQTCDSCEVDSQQMTDVNPSPVHRCLPTVGWAPCTPGLMLNHCVSTMPRTWRGCKQALLFSVLYPCLIPVRHGLTRPCRGVPRVIVRLITAQTTAAADTDSPNTAQCSWFH
jgi:hypothetical protein